MNRLMATICSDNLTQSKYFYTTLFDLTVAFDSDWFIQLVGTNQALELGIINRTNDLIPETFQQTPQGVYITFVVEDVNPIFELVQSEGFAIVQEPHDTFYGQRRLLLKDPDGTLVDVSSPIPNFKF